jgi:hypothetical protein
VINADTAGQSINNCPYQYVCMYTVSGWNNGTNGKVEHKYFTYDCYNLNNELGIRYILNNQSGGALVSMYLNYGCTSKDGTIYPQSWGWGDITPINSLKLYA